MFKKKFIVKLLTLKIICFKLCKTIMFSVAISLYHANLKFILLYIFFCLNDCNILFFKFYFEKKKLTKLKRKRNILYFNCLYIINFSLHILSSLIFNKAVDFHFIFNFYIITIIFLYLLHPNSNIFRCLYKEIRCLN